MVLELQQIDQHTYHRFGINRSKRDVNLVIFIFRRYRTFYRLWKSFCIVELNWIKSSKFSPEFCNQTKTGFQSNCTERVTFMFNVPVTSFAYEKFLKKFCRKALLEHEKEDNSLQFYGKNRKTRTYHRRILCKKRKKNIHMPSVGNLGNCCHWNHSIFAATNSGDSGYEKTSCWEIRKMREKFGRIFNTIYRLQHRHGSLRPTGRLRSAHFSHVRGVGRWQMCGCSLVMSSCWRSLTRQKTCKNLKGSKTFFMLWR